MRNITFLIIFFTNLIFAQEYYNLDINETGESTLIIFQDQILTLNEGDEIGIFDINGISNNSGDTGEILVGSGVWNNEQLEIVAIMGVDLSQFGGPILPGANDGNDIVIKIWNPNEQLEYIPSFTIEAGSGTFNNLFTVISYLSCSDGEVEDECGICNGPGAIYECGCSDIPYGECDCYGNIEDCSGVCNGFLEVDECGICGGDNSTCADCEGVPNGEGLLDECGICNGPGIIEGTCDCDGNVLDCLGICNGNALIDDCGICNGDGTECDNSEAVLSFYDLGGYILTNISYENLYSQVCIANEIISSTDGFTLEASIGNCINLTESSGSFPIYMKNSQSVSGFQFNLTGIDIVEATGGIAGDLGFSVSHSSSLVIGFSFSGISIEPLGNFYGCTDEYACNYDLSANVSDDSCEYPEEGYDCDGNCLDEDCAGECGGAAVEDECGVCEGPGAIYECDDGTFACNEIDCNNDGDGGGGGNDGECEENEILDCHGNCGPSSWLGDGYCDTSTIDYNCLEYAFDEGDCEINYNPNIASILNNNCTIYCHSGDANYQNHLNLDSYEGLMAGGDSGAAVVPYYPDYSLIIQKLNGTASGSQMPPGDSSLPENYISTIYHWIAQGALPPEDNGEGGCIENGQIEDCLGNCVDQGLLGNGNCDDGEEGEANFNCPQFLFDYADGIGYPDCPVGILEFGDFVYSNDQGTIEILMNCEFPVSNFEIILSGLSIIDANGGAAEEANFNVIVSDSLIQGSSIDSLSYVPQNSGLLTIVEFDSILDSEICFENSIITTTIGMSYEAVLGDCLDISEWLSAGDVLPERVSIDKIYPNPFNPITNIDYSLSKNQRASLNIYDINGRYIYSLFNNKFHLAGHYKHKLDASDLPSGIYILKLETVSQVDYKKLIFTK